MLSRSIVFAKALQLSPGDQKKGGKKGQKLSCKLSGGSVLLFWGRSSCIGLCYLCCGAFWKEEQSLHSLFVADGSAPFRLPAAASLKRRTRTVCVIRGSQVKVPLCAPQCCSMCAGEAEKCGPPDITVNNIKACRGKRESASQAAEEAFFLCSCLDMASLSESIHQAVEM